jgi:hypothetical protein
MNRRTAKEIGSEFFLQEEEMKELLSGDVFQHNDKFRIPGDGDMAFLRSGRDAIGFVLDESGLNSGTALLPAYSCNSMTEPFACRGYVTRYYRVDRSLNPDLQDIKDAFRSHVDVMLHMDWFGLRVSGEAVSLARSLSEQVILLEDRTHTLFSTDHSQEKPDYAVASLRKWFAVPDGAAALAFGGKFRHQPDSKTNPFTELRREGLLWKGRYIKNPSEEAKMNFRNLFAMAEGSLDGGLTVLGMSPDSLRMLQMLDCEELKRKRCSNFTVLERELAGLRGVTPLCPSLREGVCPFSYPVLVEEDRDRIQEELAALGIYCPVLWALPDGAAEVCPVSAGIAGSMLSIPCDQRYEPEDMTYIAEAMRKIMAFLRKGEGICRKER